MKNKICIVTGANSGIGKVTAQELASKGAIVIMVCRNKEKGQQALEEIVTKTKNQNLELIVADFSSQKEILRAANEIKTKYPIIDVLVNNAGAINETRTETVDGYETTFAVNHLGYFLFTKLLLDNLKSAPKARIINVASMAQQMGKLNFDDLQTKISYSPMKAYSLSKLANVIFTYELANRLKNSNITANCVHPGVVNTNFGNELKGVVKFIFKLFVPLMRDANKGAETSIWLATAPELEGVSGKYFADKKEKKTQPDSYKPEIQQKFWEVSEKMIIV